MINSASRIVRLLDTRGPRAIAGFTLAVALWSVFIDCFIDGLSMQPEPARPMTLDARLVIVESSPAPPPPAPAATPAARPAARAAAAPSRPLPAPHRMAPRITPLSAPLSPHDAVPADRATPSPLPAQPAPPATQPGAGQTSNAPSSLVSSPGAASVASGNGTAHPILQPLPALPDDLREYAYQAVALARFSIHPDGSVDVMLVRPTQNPRLNQLLLEALRKWRFFPAMKNGQPVESEQDIRVHFNVD